MHLVSQQEETKEREDTTKYKNPDPQNTGIFVAKKVDLGS